MKIYQLLMLCLLGSAVCSDSHSLHFYFTRLSTPIPGLPIYFIIGYVDDMPFGKYTSETRLAQPFYKWMEERFGPEHWEELTKLGRYYENSHKDETPIIQSLVNKTHTMSTLQVKFACELREDGTIRGYEEFGFNGKEFIVFDKERMHFIPATTEAQVITQRWNSENINALRQKDHIDRDCYGWINKYFTVAKDELERKVLPKVKISSQEFSSYTKLRCQVYGFYPRDVDVKWIKNRVDDVNTEEAKQILPNPDGTYQTRVTVEVTLKEGDTYSCYVDHSSLEETVIIPWDPPNHFFLPIIIGVIVLIAAIVAAGIGYVVYKKRSGKKKTVYTLATSSENTSVSPDCPESSVSGCC
ncbi:class I histocompatibility antigen, F10 alpha chain-like [Discoglossus pictus]